MWPSVPVIPARMNGKRSSISSLEKNASSGCSTPFWTKSASWNELTVTQSGERPARACSSRRACSAPMSWLKNSNWTCQSGCASAHFCQAAP